MFLLQAASIPLWLQITLPIITALLGLSTGLILQKAKLELFAQQTKHKAELLAEQEKLKSEEIKTKEKELNAIRLNYLDPLLIATKDFTRRIERIKEKLTDKNETERVLDWFNNIKHPKQKNILDFAYWCNGQGYFAVSTIYITAVYFYQVNKIQREFPLYLIEKNQSKTLLDLLNEVRGKLGEKYGIYATIQDSVGDYIKTAESYMSYRQFCERLFVESERAWLLNVIDYYRELDHKPMEEINNAIQALEKLNNFVESISGLRS